MEGYLRSVAFCHPRLNWALGCGSKVLFWRDSWLEGYGPLNQHTIPIQDIPKNLLKCSVADMVDDGGQW
jgi:hypothetical protein